MSRVLDIVVFLEQCGWGEAEQAAFPADFSTRRFARLMQADGRTAILMDADPDQKTSAFIAIAGLLRQAGLSAPEIFAADPPRGFVLMEDFGNRNIGRLLDEGVPRQTFYERAVALLARLHEEIDKGKLAEAALPIFDTDLFVEQAGLFLEWHAAETSAEARDAFVAALREALQPIAALPQSLMLRDFMPDNLMDLSVGSPRREGARSIGLLDFQDGGIGPVAYDIASLCEEVRRDGGLTLLEPMAALYSRLRGVDLVTLLAACRALSAQRHLRILGLLAKRAAGGSTDKNAYIPRIRGALAQLLAAENLAPLRQAVARWL